jgi:hypothetical protein
MKKIFFILSLVWANIVISQTSTLNVAKVAETATTVDVRFSLDITPSIIFYSCNFQILFPDLTSPTQVSTTSPSASYVTNITNIGGLVLNSIVDAIPNAASVGSTVSWLVRFTKGTSNTITFAIGGINECLSTDGNDFPATIAGQTISLPITLTRFQAQNTEGSNQLKWETTSEKNASHFEIEKSRDGKDFENIGQVKAAGNTNTPQYYDFLDKNPYKLSYYRLKMVDVDNTFEYSKIISLALTTKGFSAKVYPNPFQDNATIEIINESKSDVMIEVYNMVGKLVKRQKIENTEGVVSLPFDINNLVSGAYQVRIISGSNTVLQKIIKE